MKIAIIGSGFSGIGAAIRLQKKGHQITVFEQGDRVGGTWRDNTYPGCECDIASTLYSFSFAQNPNWSSKYAGYKEIFIYLDACVDRFKLRDKIIFNTKVISCVFDGVWKVSTSDKHYEFDFVIMATGPLNRLRFPAIEGLASFEGEVMHTGKWNHQYDFKKKKVAVIGTGASAVQVIPALAKEVASLHIFQRSAAWLVAKGNERVAEHKKKRIRRFPFLMNLKRQIQFWKNELTFVFFAVNWLNKLFEKNTLQFLKTSVKDHELRNLLTPDYRIACKRVLKSDDFYPALQLEHVSLTKSEILKIEEKHIITKNETIEVDAIVFATGFRASDFNNGILVRGSTELDLATHWEQNGFEAYKGVFVNGFPNFAYLLGPNSGLGHNSIVHIIESQVEAIGKVIKHCQQGEIVDVKLDVQKAYQTKLSAWLKDSIWQSGCVSWYQNEKGKNTVLWPKTAFSYRKEMKRVSKNDFNWRIDS